MTSQQLRSHGEQSRKSSELRQPSLCHTRLCAPFLTSAILNDLFQNLSTTGKKRQWTPGVATMSEMSMSVMSDLVPSQGPRGLWGGTDPSCLHIRPLLECAMNKHYFHRVPQANPCPHP